ncbi:chitin disaccharide deacetylase [Photobacterium alginatilyticum]|uniref:chitin disaccharide deacetylase n=1 Tax=Photobacterium alginatilyticum TaxID=1775171 RepID=UPI004067B150
MHVIFNADDFGLTPGVNLGIVDACLSGVVRSTTLMVGMEAEKHAVDLASSAPALKVGLHLRFTAGAPLTDIPFLVGEDGLFEAKEECWRMRDFSPQVIANEVIAQIERFNDTGLSLSHIDSHHHAHMHPKILPVVQEIARDYQVPLRATEYQGNKRNDYRYAFDGSFFGESISLDKVLQIINRHRGSCDVLEIMVHPAYVDQAIMDVSSYNIYRAKELDILTDSKLSEALDELGVTVSDYSILSS